ncbi:MAG: AraC family transcriptional regulator [Oscillospiraceae bacterium]|nr:AraC family transcriptional regulator [Oscillospiraceae bacterium]
MYFNSAYWNNSRIDFKDKTHPLFVGSCGMYRLITRPLLPTHRPRGRLDFQMLYIASGKAQFYFRGVERMVPAGHMVIYRPKEEQKYRYYGADQTEVYWVHFTGNNVRNIMRQYGIADSDQVIFTGTSLEYKRLFTQMIQEMQLRRENYEEFLVLLLRQLFILLHRQMQQRPKAKSGFLEKEIQQALQYFQEHYNSDISIDAYASSRGMSTSWFIRSFKEITGVTPMRYILTTRITNAQSLLEDTDYNIAEISRIVGYEDQMYFSRLFKKQNGVSPSEFRRQSRRVPENPDG